jgi:hypothetical protein
MYKKIITILSKPVKTNSTCGNWCIYYNFIWIKNGQEINHKIEACEYFWKKQDAINWLQKIN